MAQNGWRVRLRAWFDRTMDRGTSALIGWLGLVSAVLIVAISVPVWIFAPQDNNANGNFFHVLWNSLLSAIDAGTIGGDSGGVAFFGLMFAVTLGGIFIVSSLIGVITTGMDSRIAELRKGRSPVVESGHAIILGWSDQVFTVVSELAKANQSGKKSTVVVLADRDKVEMEDEVRARVGDTGRTRVMCRSGSPLKKADLDLVSLDTARSVIVLSPSGEDADVGVIKSLLLLQYRTWGTRRPHVVAAVQRTENLAAARLAGGPHAQVIDADDIAVRLVVQSHRQAGLSTVCTDLLNFDGNEIYMKDEPKLVGATYADALQSFELGAPIGLCDADGTVHLNPAMSTLIAAGQKVIVIAEDDTQVRLAGTRTPIVEAAIVASPEAPTAPDRTLLIGWNSRATRIIELLDRLVEPGSIVDVASITEPDLAGLAPKVLTLRGKQCNPTSRRSLEGLDLGAYKHIIVLADDTFDPPHADDRNLVTLLHLRDIEVQLGDPYSIITEMNDDGNREVAQVTKADDFIVSNKLISLLLAQMAENRHLQEVFAELFDPSGAEIYLKPAPIYVQPGAEVNFATVIEAARRRGETAIGFRTKVGGDEAPGYGVNLNPAKSPALTLTADDTVIIVAAN